MEIPPSIRLANKKNTNFACLFPVYFANFGDTISRSFVYKIELKFIFLFVRKTN